MTDHLKKLLLNTSGSTDPVIEIVDADSGSVIVCDRFSHCVSCDDGFAEEAEDIIAALDRGEFYTLGGGAAASFIVRPAPSNVIA